MYTAILSYSRLQKGEPLKAPGSKQRDFVLKGICEEFIRLCEHFFHCIHPSPTQLELYSLGYM